MQIIRDTSAINPEPSVATIGFFDGVHAGHRYLIQQVKEIAAAKGLRSALVTFPVHPRKVMNVAFSCLQSFPESVSFPMSHFFASGGQIIGVSVSASVLQMNIWD